MPRIPSCAATVPGSRVLQVQPGCASPSCILRVVLERSPWSCSSARAVPRQHQGMLSTPPASWKWGLEEAPRGPSTGRCPQSTSQWLNKKNVDFSELRSLCSSGPFCQVFFQTSSEAPEEQSLLGDPFLPSPSTSSAGQPHFPRVLLPAVSFPPPPPPLKLFSLVPCDPGDPTTP